VSLRAKTINPEANPIATVKLRLASNVPLDGEGLNLETKIAIVFQCGTGRELAAKQKDTVVEAIFRVVLNRSQFCRARETGFDGFAMRNIPSQVCRPMWVSAAFYLG
jgi:hypothetical protein